MMVACHWKEENKRRPSESSVLSNGSNVLNLCACVHEYQEKYCHVENSPFYSMFITTIKNQGILRASRELNVGLLRKKLLTSHNFLASLLLSFFPFVEHKWVKNPSSTSYIPHVLLYVENHVLNDDVFIALGEGYEGKYLARGDEVLNELLDDRKAKCFPSRPFVHTRQLQF